MSDHVANAVLVRESLAADLAHVADLFSAMAGEIISVANDPYFDGVPVDADSLAVVLSDIVDSGGTIFLAEHDDRIIGFIAVTTAAPYTPGTIKQVGRIELCYVDAAFRGQGIARRLTARAEKWCIGKGVSYVELNYVTGNQGAARNWDALGYAPYRISARKRIG